MRLILALVLMITILGFSGICFAQDITIKEVPDSITAETLKEWCSVLIERNENQKIQQIPELVNAQKTAQTTVDSFRKANLLNPKYEAKQISE